MLSHICRCRHAWHMQGLITFVTDCHITDLVSWLKKMPVANAKLENPAPSPCCRLICGHLSLDHEKPAYAGLSQYYPTTTNQPPNQYQPFNPPQGPPELPPIQKDNNFCDSTTSHGLLLFRDCSKPAISRWPF